MKGLVVAILVAWLGTSATGIGAQEQIDLNKPTIEIVRAVGCASRAMHQLVVNYLFDRFG